MFSGRFRQTSISASPQKRKPRGLKSVKRTFFDRWLDFETCLVGTPWFQWFKEVMHLTAPSCNFLHLCCRSWKNSRPPCILNHLKITCTIYGQMSAVLVYGSLHNRTPSVNEDYKHHAIFIVTLICFIIFHVVFLEPTYHNFFVWLILDALILEKLDPDFGERVAPPKAFNDKFYNFFVEVGHFFLGLAIRAYKNLRYSVSSTSIRRRMIYRGNHFLQ